jgi:hypothetical protein
MSSDNQFTALGPAIVGFQTDGANIDVGAQIAGSKVGGNFHCDEGPGVLSDSHTAAVSGSGGLRGVYGRGESRFNSPGDTTGVLAEGYSEATGAIGISFSASERSALGHSPGVLGVSNADSQRDARLPKKLLGAGVVGVSRQRLPHLIDTTEPLPLPDLKAQPDGDGTGVWGVSGGGIGVHGESVTGRGGVFSSQKAAQLRLVPQISPTPTLTLPAHGQPGDLYMIETAPIGHGTTAVTMYLCVSSGSNANGNRAHWAPFLLGPAQIGGP